MEDPIDAMMSFLCWFLTALFIIVFVALTTFGLFEAANWAWLPVQTDDDAIIADISFEAQHETSSAKSRETVPDTWFLDIKTRVGYDWLSIRHAPWSWQQKGSHVIASYSMSRLTGDLDVHDITNQ